MIFDLDALKGILAEGLLAFPVTWMNPDQSINLDGCGRFIDRMTENEPSALFVAGGTGEFFSLTSDEHERIIRTASEAAAGRIPIIAGVGYGTATAISYARAAERAGADAILILPHYLITAEQAGLIEHIRRICAATALGVIVYSRDNAVYAPETLLRLADTCPNLIGLKDGHGDIELMVNVRHRCGDRLVYLGGMPTAEVFATAYDAIGVPTYSSAVFNVLPKTAKRFYAAVRKRDTQTTERLLRDFFLPLIELRNRRRGYAVSMIKCGMRAMGQPVGGVRAPLVELTPEEERGLEDLLIKTAKQWEN